MRKLIRFLSDFMGLLIKAAFLMDNLNHRLNSLIDSILVRMSSILRMQPVA